MKKIVFNDNWRFARQSCEFLGTPTQPYQEISVPHDALIHEERVKGLPGERNTGSYPYGTYEYKKDLYLKPEWKGKKLLLLFEGVYAASQVYVNNMLAGSCMNGYISFVVDLNPYLKDGKNEITLICRCYRDSRWYSGAGIYRDVYLLVSDHLFLSYGRSSVRTEEITSSEAVLETRTAVKNETAETKHTKVIFSIYDRQNNPMCRAERTTVLFPGEEKLIRQRLVVNNPALWEPDSPNLYHCEISIPDIDQDEFDFGIRMLSLSKNRGIVLNGKPVKLRGTCIHHDNGIIGSCAYKESAYRRIRLLKESGINAIRIAHHPAGTDILEACDRLGMLVMNEVSDAWTICKNPYDAALYFNRDWEEIVSSMVSSSMNHPSVILYSLGNEIVECGNPKGAQFAWKLNEKIKELDPDRFTIISMNVLLCMIDMRPSPDNNNSKDVNEAMTKGQHVFKTMITSRETAELVEEAMGYADIVGYNYGDSRYLIDKTEYPERILCGSETFSFDLAANWKLVTGNPHIIGDFNWTGWDYIGEAGIGMMEYPSESDGKSWWRLAFCGDFDLNGNRRAQSYYRQAVWGLAQHPWVLVQDPAFYGLTPEQTPWSFFDGVPVWDFPGSEGKPASVQIYSDAGEVELFLNGRSLGRKPAGESTGFITEFTVPYEPGILTAVSYQNGIENGKWELSSGKGSPDLRLTMEPSYSPDNNIHYYRIQNLYENGVPEIHTPVKVRLKVKNGELLGLGSADPKSCERYDSDTCTLYQGQALAVIKGDPAAEVIIYTI